MTPIPIPDTTVFIWDYLFKVRVPYLQSRSIDDIRKHGVALSGVAEIDNDIHNQWQTTMISIAKMVTFYREGVPIRVSAESDVKLIYEHISNHIHAWKTRLENGINIGDAPIDDLIMMDQFASTIYEHAKYQFTPEIVNSLLAQHMTSVQRVNAHNFFSSSVMSKLNNPDHDGQEGITMINGEGEDAYPERDTLSEFFKNRLVNLRRY